MADQGIIRWLKQVRVSGFSDEQIKKELQTTGWNDSQINELLTDSHSPKKEAAKIASIAQEILPSGKKVKSKVQRTTGPKFKKKTIMIAAGVTVLVLLLGGGAFAYMKGYLPLPFLAGDAEALLKQSFVKLAASKGGEVGFTFQIASEKRASGLKPFNFSMDEIVGETGPRQAAKNATAQSDLSQLRVGLVLYADDNKGMYPSSIDELAPSYISTTQKHPDGDAYGYTVSNDKKSFELSTKCLGGDTKKATIKSDGTTTQCDSVDSSLDISPLSIIDSALQWIPSDLDINGEFTTFTTYKTEDANKRKSIFTLKGSLNTGGTTFNVDGEVRQKDQKTYVQIRQFPSLFFFDVSALKDKWILIDPTDQDASLMGLSVDDITEGVSETLPKKEETEDLKKELPHLVDIAFDTKVFVAVKDGKETIENHPTHRIKITIDPQKLPDFVTAYRDNAKSRKVDLTNVSKLGNIDEMLTNVSKPEFVQQATDFFRNTSFTVWVDQSGSKPRKIICDIIVIPPEKLEKLKNRQVRFSFGLTFDHLGEEPSVKTPDNIITLDEVERLLTGVTVEQQQLEKQITAVQDIRSGLSQYYVTNKSYPDSLNALLDERPAMTQNISLSGDTYISKTIKTLPISIYPDTAFSYTPSADNYTLTYTIIKPTEEANNDSLFGSGFSYYANQVVDGKNTANKNYLSIEAEGTKDYDKDGLTDLQEKEYGTSKYSADTDGDGYSDKEEIEAGFDPLKKPTAQ